MYAGRATVIALEKPIVPGLVTCRKSLSGWEPNSTTSPLRYTRIDDTRFREHSTAQSLADAAKKRPLITFSGRLLVDTWGTVQPRFLRSDRMAAGKVGKASGSSRTVDT